MYCRVPSYCRGTQRTVHLAQGYAAPLRGDTPYEIKKLMDRKRIPDPDGKNASIAAENARIDHQNLQNETERSARLDEIKNCARPPVDPGPLPSCLALGVSVAVSL